MTLMLGGWARVEGHQDILRIHRRTMEHVALRSVAFLSKNTLLKRTKRQ